MCLQELSGFCTNDSGAYIIILLAKKSMKGKINGHNTNGNE